MSLKFVLPGFKYFVLFLTALCILTTPVRSVLACSVPVFRYALERWKPDPYKGIYIYRGTISEQARALLDQLNNAANADSPLNLIIRPVNADTFSKKKLTELFQDSLPDELPLLTVWYPNQMGKSPPFLQEKLTSSLVSHLVQSPKRKEMAESLINGDSIVWVFIPSGNNKKDGEALKLIKEELDSELPKYSNNPFTVLAGSTRKKLTYRFPVLTVSRDDPAERIFIETLMKSESDLYRYADEPMVFPVFGRGRSLGCLFGKYITRKKIEEATFFLSGACSCEIKNLNPGVDLLISAPWEIVVLNSFVDAEPMPELTGVLPDFDDARVPVTSLGEDSMSEKTLTPESSMNLYAVYGGTLAAVILAVAVAGILIRRQRKE